MDKNLTYKVGDGCELPLCRRGVGRSNHQLNTFDYLADIPGNDKLTDLVEVQFKNTRKGYFHNINNLDLQKGDIVAVEASPGHDIGIVTLTGKLVELQVAKVHFKSPDDIKRIYRHATEGDIDKWEEAKSREHGTMIQSRQIAKDLQLKMKIGDVEYQGDGNKAIFYYIADERVDFRQLIKVLADTFHVRIEMKQIGARQEAGRIGGTGPCGRELCCATWMKSFSSVSTVSARFQDLSMNPQKLAGMCAKLKCCLNYEVDNYMEAGKKMPSKDAILQTIDGDFYLFKQDILAGMVTYSSDKRMAANLQTITAERAQAIIEMNKRGEKPGDLLEDGERTKPNKPDDIFAGDVTRFDKPKKNKKNKNSRSDKETAKQNATKQTPANQNADVNDSKDIQQASKEVQRTAKENNKSAKDHKHPAKDNQKPATVNKDFVKENAKSSEEKPRQEHRPQKKHHHNKHHNQQEKQTQQNQQNQKND